MATIDGRNLLTHNDLRPAPMRENAREGAQAHVIKRNQTYSSVIKRNLA